MNAGSKKGATMEVKISLQFAADVERGLHPLTWLLVVIWSFVILGFLIVLIGGDAERNSDFYGGHDETLYLFGLSGVHKVHRLFLDLGLFCQRMLGLVLDVGVMFESFCTYVEGLFFSEGQFGVHLFYLSLDGIIEIGVIHGGRRGLFWFFQIDHFYFLPQFSFRMVAGDDCLLVGSWTGLKLLLFWFKDYSFFLGQDIGGLFFKECLMKLIGNSEIGAVLSWAWIGTLHIEDTLFIGGLAAIGIFLEWHSADGGHGD